MKRKTLLVFVLMLFMLLVGCAASNITEMTETVSVIEATETASLLSSELHDSDIVVEEIVQIENVPPTEVVKIEDKDITFSIELFADNEDIMPYFLYTPSTREISSEPIPLIIWLHGGDEYYCKLENMIKRGLPAALENWGELDGFDAYIVCPQMTGKWKYFAGWQTETNRKNLDNILADVLARNPIDTEKIIIAGHSIGGRGAITNALHNVNEFDYYKVVAISGFVEDYDLQFFKELDIRFYTGKIATGENEGVYYHNVRKMTKYFGEENLFIVDGSHADSPVKAFLLDEDGNNKSDLIEWMLADKLI